MTQQASKAKEWLNRGRNSALVSFILLALIGGWAIKSSADSSAERLYQTQIEACEGSNDNRRESNQRVGQHRTDTSVLRDFLLSAATARSAAYERDGEAADLVAAKAYEQGAERLRAVNFNQLPLVNCQKAIKKP